MKALTLALLSSTIAASAYAQEDRVTVDAKCSQVEYHDSAIIGITSYVGHAMFIKLDTQERIEKFLAGANGDDAPITVPDPQKMNNQPLHSTLPLWATKPGKTNVVILSLLPDDVTEHTYMIDINVKAPKKDESDADATYCLKFTYNDQIKQEKAKVAATAAPQRRQDIERKKAEDRLSVDCPFAGEQNWKYTAAGDRSIAPTAVSDNYSCTAFRFPGNMPKPAVFIADSGPWCDLSRSPPDDYLKAPERAVRADAKDDFLIVHETAEHFRFRMGNQSETGRENGHVVDVSNCGYNPFRGNPGTGTPTPGVVRQVITER